MSEMDAPQPEPKDGDFPDDANGTNGTENQDIVSQPVRQRTVAKLRRFLVAYAETGLLYQSCEVAGIGKMTHYRLLKTDPVYQRAIEETQEQVGQMLDDLAVERVRNGEYHSHMHHILLKRFRRELYKERIEQQISGEITVVERIGTARKRLLEMNRSGSDAKDLAG